MGETPSLVDAPAPNVQNLGVQAYAQSVGVTAGQTLVLCVQPGQTFSVAFYQQGAGEVLVPAPGPAPLPGALQWVTQTGAIFTSFNLSNPQTPDLDWNWPCISYAIPPTWTSGVYFAVVYPVNAQTGVATDALGIAVQAGDPNGQIKPHPDLSVDPIVAWDHGMALFVVRPSAAQVAQGTVQIAYVLSTSTYQAYNNTGGGCFYYSNPVKRVTLRRPGCGVGSIIMNDETDSFDTTSKRNTYAHWDSYFVRWLLYKNISCHFYTNLDMDYMSAAQPSPVMNGATPIYKLMLCVGHDEYWSAAIRVALEAFQQANGNVAIFSGNTAYRPVNFGAPSTTASRYDPPTTPIPSDAKSIINRLNDSWPDPLNEASTIGVTWKTGAGSWSPDKVRSNSGYTSLSPIIGVTGTFGVAECIVGYECDALFAGHSPSNFVVLAHADLTNGNQWDQTGKADMGYFQKNLQAPAMKSILFNAATTDWSRLLPLGPTTNPTLILVGDMTSSTISTLTA
jgi:hypothetical protein